ncbi:DUF3761 domain-containing protein [bacterium]|nr:MAG: DUF3761 domain-containing protein [bacterium]
MLIPEEREARKGARAIIAALLAVPLLIGGPLFLVTREPAPIPSKPVLQSAPSSNWSPPTDIGEFENDPRFVADPTATPYAVPQYTPSWRSGSSSTDVSGSAPARSGGRTGAKCNDGSYSEATGRGACSHHGGVAQWLYS